MRLPPSKPPIKRKHFNAEVAEYSQRSRRRLRVLCALFASSAVKRLNFLLRISDCCGSTEDDGALRRQHPAIAVGDRGFAIGDLARAAFVAQLPCRLDQ